MITIEYVLSAVAQGLFPNNKDLSADHMKEIKYGLNRLVQIVDKDLKEKCKHYNPELSILFNAYTEEQYIPMLKFLDKVSMKNIYADSGGLQIVTAGKEKTEEVKQNIYEIQTYADFAMCFDEIPLTRREDGGERTRNERSNTRNKIFHESGLVRSGMGTGENIKKQIEHFRNVGATTKVIPIVQGNSWQDMVTFFKQIEKQLDDADYDYINGLAVADTCIGNGELESIEMLQAARAIANFAHPNISKHLHILGVGSIARMRPIVYLIRSKYLDTFKHISYDSSSHTSTFTYGLLKLDGTCIPIGQKRSKKNIEHFTNVYSFFQDYFKEKRIKCDRFLEILLGEKIQAQFLVSLPDWKHSSTKERSMTQDDTTIIIAHMAKAFHVLFQIHNFCYNIDKLFTEKWKGTPITNLLRVKDDKSMNNWIDAVSKQLKSKRISRNENKITLEGIIQ